MAIALQDGARAAASALAQVGGPRVRWYLAGAAAAWTAVVVVSFLVYRQVERDHTVAAATAAARGFLDRDAAYRRWVSSLGTLYAPVDKVAPNPRLAGVPHRDLEIDGIKLTLVNPAYMTRLVYQQAESPLPSLRLTSLRPLYPGGQADPWEAAALRQIEAGADDVREVLTRDGKPVLRFLRGDRVLESCLRCHAAQGYRVGDVRGGLSVVMSLEADLRDEMARLNAVALGHGGVWVAGMAFLVVAGASLGRRVREREQALRQQARLEEELSRARRLEALGRLAGGVAHDFNNLLTPILGNAALGLEAPGLDGPQRAELGEILAAAERARDLTRRLLVFGRPGAVRTEALPLAEVVAGTEPLLRRLIGEDVVIQVRTDAATPHVMADRTQLELALTNLSLNARDAMPGGGTLSISTGARLVGEAEAARLGVRPGRYASLEVRDAGHGMEAEVLAHLFEPFFTTKAPGRGTGLGLASVHADVTRLGGAVEVESKPGLGTVVRLLLPATEAPAPAAPVARVATPRGQESILVVEDDAAVRRFVTASLTGLGYRVTATGDPLEAGELAARAGRFDLLVSDVVMPGRSGYEVWRQLQAEGRVTRALFMSGYSAGLDDPFVAMGGPRLTKPFTPDELGRKVRAALDGPALPPSP